MRLILDIILGGVSNVLANKSIMMNGFTSCQYISNISSLNDYRKLLLNNVES